MPYNDNEIICYKLRYFPYIYDLRFHRFSPILPSSHLSQYVADGIDEYIKHYIYFRKQQLWKSAYISHCMFGTLISNRYF